MGGQNAGVCGESLVVNGLAYTEFFGLETSEMDECKALLEALPEKRQASEAVRRGNP
jgi:hypothetical protein